MICLTCNASNDERARLCANCGVALNTEEIPPRPYAVSPANAATVDLGHDPLLGSNIAGKYRIEAKLGAGGMGAVYRATRLLIGDEVAVKILHAGQHDPNSVDRFRREAQAAARLKHPNAVTIHDFGVTDDGLQYLVMEHVDGQSLRQIIKQKGPLPPALASEITTQVCAALDAAHRQHIVHRDIKPDNIIIDSATDGLRVKVLDFGIAKLRDDVASHLTQTGSVMGTPHYMSPEQCLGEDLDSRADIYSLGIVLYEMLSGRVPFNSPVSTAVVIQQVNQPPPSLRAINPGISPQVEAVVFHALEKQREARPATAGSLARELTVAVRAANEPLMGDSTWLPTPRPPQPPAYDTQETVMQGAAPTPSQNEMPSTIQLRTDPPRLTIPSISSTANVGAPAKSKKDQNLPWKIGAMVFGCLFFGAIVAIITWNLTRENKPVDSPGAERGVNPGDKPGNTQGDKIKADPALTPSAETPLNITVSASSTRRAEPGKTYFPANVVDQDLRTAWDEDAPGPGIGSWVKCDFDREVSLNSIRIYPGYFKTPLIWAKNNRLAAATISYSDGRSIRVNFPDLMQPQDVFTGGVRTRSVKLVIEDVYNGLNDDLDTPISEMRFDWKP